MSDTKKPMPSEQTLNMEANMKGVLPDWGWPAYNEALKLSQRCDALESSLADVRGQARIPAGCVVDPLLSRVCERGTKSCNVVHDPVRIGAPTKPEPAKDEGEWPKWAQIGDSVFRDDADGSRWWLCNAGSRKGEWVKQACAYMNGTAISHRHAGDIDPAILKDYPLTGCKCPSCRKEQTCGSLPLSSSSSPSSTSVPPMASTTDTKQDDAGAEEWARRLVVEGVGNTVRFHKHGQPSNEGQELAIPPYCTREAVVETSRDYLAFNLTAFAAAQTAKLREENERLRSDLKVVQDANTHQAVLINQRIDQAERLEARAEKAESERDSLRSEVERLRAGWPSCAWCNAQLAPHGTPVGEQYRIGREHSKVCPNHPMRAVEKERNSLREKMGRIAECLDRYNSATTNAVAHRAIADAAKEVGL